MGAPTALYDGMIWQLFTPVAGGWMGQMQNLFLGNNAVLLDWPASVPSAEIAEVAETARSAAMNEDEVEASTGSSSSPSTFSPSSPSSSQGSAAIHKHRPFFFGPIDSAAPPSPVSTRGLDSQPLDPSELVDEVFEPGRRMYASAGRQRWPADELHTATGCPVRSNPSVRSFWEAVAERLSRTVSPASPASSASASAALDSSTVRAWSVAVARDQPSAGQDASAVCECGRRRGSVVSFAACRRPISWSRSLLQWIVEENWFFGPAAWLLIIGLPFFVAAFLLWHSMRLVSWVLRALGCTKTMVVADEDDDEEEDVMGSGGVEELGAETVVEGDDRDYAEGDGVVDGAGEAEGEEEPVGVRRSASVEEVRPSTTRRRRKD